MCAFDLVANNTDRKGGHCLLGHDGHIWGIDNGLCFHAEFKLRTVIWEFGGEPRPGDAARRPASPSSTPASPTALADLLDPFERDALRTRARALVPERALPRSTTPAAATPGRSSERPVSRRRAEHPVEVRVGEPAVGVEAAGGPPGTRPTAGSARRASRGSGSASSPSAGGRRSGP